MLRIFEDFRKEKRAIIEEVDNEIEKLDQEYHDRIIKDNDRDIYYWQAIRDVKTVLQGIKGRR